jgi:3-hydroxy-9,10-secoandrosta-1,3,5(10)-triene-9,17-dione monooxygenase reductase component
LLGESTSTTVHDQVTSHDFRSVLGNFCSGITVITARGPDGPIGFTCQAFSSLSLRPPRVVLCASRSSTTWPLIRDSGTFCVNILGETQHALSDRFARSGGDKFQQVSWTLSPNGSPRLTGATAWLDCTLHSEHDGGDHVIATADVLWLDAPAGSESPLLYYQGGYARLGDRPPTGRTA